jgi:4-carboxymuconolactone decarboxylase
VTSYCWGAIWGREGLARRDRSLINLAMLAALGKTEELKLHVRGALNNGLSPDDIKEVLLQVAVYAGIPAGLSAFKAAHQVLKDEGRL